MKSYLVRGSVLEGYRETVTQLGGNLDAIPAAVGMAGKLPEVPGIAADSGVIFYAFSEGDGPD